MVRRKRKAAAIEARTILAAGACLFILWLLLKNPSVIVVLALAIIVVLAVIVALREVLPARSRRSLIVKANAAVDRNADRLARRRAQLVRQDAYGKPLLEPVQKLAKEPWKEYAERAWVDRVGACTRAI